MAGTFFAGTFFSVNDYRDPSHVFDWNAKIEKTLHDTSRSRIQREVAARVQSVAIIAFALMEMLYHTSAVLGQTLPAIVKLTFNRIPLTYTRKISDRTPKELDLAHVVGHVQNFAYASTTLVFVPPLGVLFPTLGIAAHNKLRTICPKKPSPPLYKRLQEQARTQFASLKATCKRHEEAITWIGAFVATSVVTYYLARAVTSISPISPSSSLKGKTFTPISTTNPFNSSAVHHGTTTPFFNTFQNEESLTNETPISSFLQAFGTGSALGVLSTGALTAYQHLTGGRQSNASTPAQRIGPPTDSTTTVSPPVLQPPAPPPPLPIEATPESLRDALKERKYDEAQEILNKKPSLMRKESLLQLGLFEQAEWLFGKGASWDGVDVNAKDKYQNPILLNALKGGYQDIAQSLVNKNAHVKATDRDGNPMIFPLLAEEKFKEAELLIQKDPTLVNGREKRGTPFLLHFLREHKYNVAKFLVEKNADVNIQINGKPILQILFEENLHEAAKWLMDQGTTLDAVDVDVKGKNGYPLLFHLLLRDETYHNLAQRLIEKGADVNAKTAAGDPLLLRLLENHKLAAAQLLLDNNADPNAKGRFGNPLIFSLLAEENDETAALEAIKILINKDPTIANITNVDGFPILLFCLIGKNFYSVADCLVQKGANVNAKVGEKPILQRLFEANKLEAAKWLMDRGTTLDDVNANATDENDNPILLNLLQDETYHDLAQRLIEKGANVDAKTSSGGPMLLLLLTNDKFAAANMLLDKGADPSAKDDRFNYSILLSLLLLGKLEAADILTARNADLVNTKDNEGNPLLLSFLLRENAIEAAQYLVDKGANVNAKVGEKPILQILLEKGNATSSLWLINHGAALEGVQHTAISSMLAHITAQPTENGTKLLELLLTRVQNLSTPEVFIRTIWNKLLWNKVRVYPPFPRDTLGRFLKILSKESLLLLLSIVISEAKEQALQGDLNDLVNKIFGSLDHIKEALGSGRVTELMSKLGKQFPEAFFTVNRTHIQNAPEGAGDLPPIENFQQKIGPAMDKMVAFFDAITFDDVKEPGHCMPSKLKNDGRSVTPESLRENLLKAKTRMVEKHGRENDFTAAPSRDNPQKLNAYYENLNTHVIHIVNALEECQDLDKRAAYVIQLAIAFKWCATRYKDETTEVYSELCEGGAEKQFDHRVLEWLQSHRLGFIKFLLEKTGHASISQNVHFYSDEVQKLGTALGLPKRLLRIQDEVVMPFYIAIPRTLENKLSIFYGEYYTPEKILAFLLEKLNASYSIKELFLDWCCEQWLPQWDGNAKYDQIKKAALNFVNQQTLPTQQEIIKFVDDQDVSDEIMVDLQRFKPKKQRDGERDITEKHSKIKADAQKFFETEIGKKDANSQTVKTAVRKLLQNTHGITVNDATAGSPNQHMIDTAIDNACKKAKETLAQQFANITKQQRRACAQEAVCHAIEEARKSAYLPEIMDDNGKIRRTAVASLMLALNIATPDLQLQEVLGAQ